MTTKNKNANPKISVIITCYNYGKFIDEALDSVQYQTFRDYELIIIDDCSTDEFTKNKLSELLVCVEGYNYRSGNNQVVIKSKISKLIQLKKNVGVSKARNLAIEQAKGKYILCLDADDKLHKDCLKKMYEQIITRRYDIIGSGYMLFGKEDKIQIPKKFNKFTFPLRNSLTVTSLFRKQDWEKVKGFRESKQNIGEDYDFWLSLVQEGANVYLIPEILLYYRKHHLGSRYEQFAKLNSFQMASEQLIKNNYKLYSWLIQEQRKRLRKAQKLNVKLSIGILILLITLLISIS